MKKTLLALLAMLAFSLPAMAAVDLNSASEADLQKVKGIGPVKAKAIVDYRSKNGPFKSVDELDKVKGFGPGTLKQIRDDVTVGGGAASVKADGKAADKAGKKSEKPAGK
ncbi:MAG: ComEA family DNA-binding protein [Sulfuricellaceae bacterium]|jgi:competence protein ComEA